MKKIDFKDSKTIFIIGLIVIVVVSFLAFAGYRVVQEKRETKVEGCKQTEVAKANECLNNDSLFVGCSSFF